MLNNALKNVGIDNIWNSVEILTIHFFVFFIILVAVQLLHRKDMSVLVGAACTALIRALGMLWER